MKIVGTRGKILMAKYLLPIPYPPRHLWRLDPRAFGARLGACGASTPHSSRLRRSAASQRLKPTLLLASGAATGWLPLQLNDIIQVGLHKCTKSITKKKKKNTASIQADKSACAEKSLIINTAHNTYRVK